MTCCSSGCPIRPRVLSGFEREAVLAAGARDAEESGAAPPFHVRPALIAEMLALYDRVRRLGRTVDDFDRLLTGELEPAAESDRGASQLLEQTRFLSASFRAYESAAARERRGRRTWRARAVARRRRRRGRCGTSWSRSATRRSIPMDSGLPTSRCSPRSPASSGSTSSRRPACSMPAISIASASRLSTSKKSQPAPQRRRRGTTPPALVVPRAIDPVFSYRDREDELEGVARRIKADRRRGHVLPLDRIGLVVARPLPYLYLAREVFAGAGIPFEALDTLPLAAEPYAAAVDVVLECAAANFTRRALMALLRSPHFRFEVDGAEIDRASIAALDVAMAEQRYLGGLDRLRALTPNVDRRRASGRARRDRRSRRRWRRCSNRGRSSIRSNCCERFSSATIAIITSAAAGPARP